MFDNDFELLFSFKLINIHEIEYEEVAIMIYLCNPDFVTFNKKRYRISKR